MNSPATTLQHAVGDDEWQLRCELAACYRLFVKFGWTDSIFTHLSARVPGHPDQYLINPYGLLFPEICASNLIKVDFDGNVIAGDFPYNEAGHAIHSAVLKARPDVNAVLHSHTRAGIAVSCMEEGLLPLSQQAGEIMDLVAYHHYGYASQDNPEECERIGADMGDKWMMVLHNHGLLSAGRNVAEAFYFLYTLENACKVQVDVMASGARTTCAPPEVLKQLGQYAGPVDKQPLTHAELLWEVECRLLKKTDASYLD